MLRIEKKTENKSENGKRRQIIVESRTTRQTYRCTEKDKDMMGRRGYSEVRGFVHILLLSSDTFLIVFHFYLLVAAAYIASSLH